MRAFIAAAEQSGTGSDVGAGVAVTLAPGEVVWAAAGTINRAHSSSVRQHLRMASTGSMVTWSPVLWHVRGAFARPDRR